jgi:hypothetical protein
VTAGLFGPFELFYCLPLLPPCAPVLAASIYQAWVTKRSGTRTPRLRPRLLHLPDVNLHQDDESIPSSALYTPSFTFSPPPLPPSTTVGVLQGVESTIHVLTGTPLSSLRGAFRVLGRFGHFRIRRYRPPTDSVTHTPHLPSKQRSVPFLYSPE